MGVLCILGFLFSFKVLCTAVIISLSIIYVARERAQRVETNSKHIVRADVSIIAKIANFLLWPLFWYELRSEFSPITLEDLKLDAIRKACVGDDFGNFENGSFQTVIDLVNENRKHMTPIGYFLYRSFFLATLESRLKFFNHIKNKKVEEYMMNNPVIAPTFVVGLPRCGTTFLHRLLALDPNVRAPKLYELKNPVEQVSGDVEKDAEERMKRMKAIDKGVKFTELIVGGRLQTLHETGAHLPAECHIARIDWPRSLITYHLFLGSKKEIERNNDDVFYQTYYKQLQVLSHNALKAGEIEKSRKQWVLKSPGHLRGGMDSLVKNFPDARIVWIHRDLNQCTPSLVSLLKLGQDMTMPVCDLDKLAKGALDFIDLSLSRGDEFVSKTTNPCCNVKYSEIINDPVNTVRKIYKELGNEFTVEYEKILKDYVAKNKLERELLKEKKGGKKLHSYSLADSGITKADIDRFSWYTDKYLA